MRDRRERLGVSQDVLAQRMAMRGYKWRQATVYAIERGDRRVQLGEAVAVADVLGVPLATLTHEQRRSRAHSRLLDAGNRVERAVADAVAAIRELAAARLSLEATVARSREYFEEDEKRPPALRSAISLMHRRCSTERNSARSRATLSLRKVGGWQALSAGSAATT